MCCRNAHTSTTYRTTSRVPKSTWQRYGGPTQERICCGASVLLSLNNRSRIGLYDDDDYNDDGGDDDDDRGNDDDDDDDDDGTLSATLQGTPG